MPELPEVEIVVANLAEVLTPHHKKIKFENFKLWRKDIRFPIPDRLFHEIIKSDSWVISVQRRAKFILIEFADYFIISHLGMTGSWSVFQGDLKAHQPLKHDHLALGFHQKLWLIYNDPRRFGFVQVVLKNDLGLYFSNYGLEPLSATQAELDQLFDTMSSSKAPVKSFLMNQKNIVGVGNIYACEALFDSGIDPFKPACRVKKPAFDLLIKSIQKKLKKAISLGGSSIQSYKNVKSEAGSFQNLHQVYGKEGKPCPKCKKMILRKVQAGRSTFFCSACQR